MKKIQWTNESYWATPLSLGRNGYIQTTGIQVDAAPSWDFVEICPITSKGHKGRCKVKLPKDAVPALIEALSGVLLEGIRTGERYFLFGEQACREYETTIEDDRVQAVKDTAEEYGITYATFAYNEREDPLVLLSEFDGWNDYSEITKEEYEQFNA